MINTLNNSTLNKGGDFMNLTVKELKEIAKENGVKGYSRMKKEELIKALQQFFEDKKKEEVMININDVMQLTVPNCTQTTSATATNIKGGENMEDIFVTNRAGIIFKVTGEREVNGNTILELVNCRTGRKTEIKKEMVAILSTDVAQKMLQAINTPKENINNNKGGDTMTQQTRFIVNVSQNLKNWYVYDRVDKKTYKALPGIQVQKVVKEYVRLINGYKANIKIYGQQPATQQPTKPATQKVYTCKHCGKVVSQKEIDFLAKHQEALKVHAPNAYRKVLCYDCQKKYNVLQAVKRFNAINKAGVKYMPQTQNTLR